METVKQKLTSRKFLLAAATFIAAVAEMFGLSTISALAPAELAAVAGVLVAWLTGETVLDRERISADRRVAVEMMSREAQAYIAQLQARINELENPPVTENI